MGQADGLQGGGYDPFGVLDRRSGNPRLRNDLVHAQLKFVQLEGQLQAVVVNSQETATHARPARLLVHSDFGWLKGEVGRIKAALEAA